RGSSRGRGRGQTMSSAFRAVQWNRTKLVYDGILLAGVALYIGAYLILAYWLDPPKDLPAAIDVRIRAFGSCAFLMLTIIFLIGPLARLYRRFPAAAVQWASFRRVALLRRPLARFVHARMVRGPRRVAEPLRRTDQILRL